MTKADQIVELIEQGLDYSAIADHVGCHVGYVRAVKQRKITAVERCKEWFQRRQRDPGYRRTRRKRYRYRYATDPEYREYEKRRSSEHYYRRKKKNAPRAGA